MIIHGQIFDINGKRSLADFTQSQQNSNIINFDDLSQNCENLFLSINLQNVLKNPVILDKTSNL
jgi:hypothetical protein